jgi:GT2 family glycosyltransferase
VSLFPPSRDQDTSALAEVADAADVAVIVCAFTMDRSDSLVEAVRSLARQTLRPQEVIVVVDHSDELLCLAAQTLPVELEGVRILASVGRPGLSGARNTGIAESSAEIVAFLDDDAVAEPDWLAQLVAPYRDGKVMATGATCVPAWQVERPWWFPAEFNWVVGCSYRGLPDRIAEVRNPIGAAMSMRRVALTIAGNFREGVGRVGSTPLGCEETELAIRIRQCISGARILHVPAAVVAHAVPAQRSGLRYFVRRCRAEGLSKAQVGRLVGNQQALESERAYVQRILPSGFAAGLADAWGGDGSGLGRAAMMVAGLAVTTLGFVMGRLMPNHKDLS